MENDKLKKIVETLNLTSHPEGGYFRETYRSDEQIDSEYLPRRYSGSRNLCTAIYYLITSDSFSAMHRLKSDEVLHFYMGDTASVFMIYPSGKGKELKLGRDLGDGAVPQVVVPQNVWFGIRVAGGGEYTLLGSTVSPGFDFDDFEMGRRESLTSRYPQHTERIKMFTDG